MTLDQIKQQLHQFAKERNWEQFHNPKNLAAMATAVEVGELVEISHWLSEHEAIAVAVHSKKQAIAHELADIMMYVIRLSDVLNVDLNNAIQSKLKLNEKKYPIDLVKGKAEKYSEY